MTVEGASLVIVKRCGCPERGLPLRVLPEAVAFFQQCVPAPPADLPVLTHRCHKCKTTVTLTAGDLHLAA